MEVQQQILYSLDKCDTLYSHQYATSTKLDHQKIVGAIKSLESLGNIISVRQATHKSWECTEEGVDIASNGSHEVRLFKSLPAEGRTVSDIKTNFPNSNFAMGAAMKNKWVKKDGEKIIPAVFAIEDEVQVHLKAILSGAADTVSDKIKTEYKKRKLIKQVDLTVFVVKKGTEFTTSIVKQDTELTKEMIESGQWKDKTFKPFNFKAKGRVELRVGHLHPLLQLRSEFRKIFLEMGFTEMPTNNYVESAFWNFDALFQPQQHPARDAQDTFYVADPATTIEVPEDYLQRVKETHSTGGYGSIGYQYDWKRDEAYKNLLRTHTTAVSARMLYKLAQDGFKPAKYFSIDRVFRNETLDATHLAEFQQVEGVVADYNFSVKNLMGVIGEFYRKIGLSNLRFKPAFNPYTEPSMEVFGFHEGLKKWVEIGNSGLFRPEMLRPMGLPENVFVCGFGLSLERPAMIMFGINNIRELVGPRVKMELIYDNPVCTINKFKDQPKVGTNSSLTMESLTTRQELIIEKLSALQVKVANIACKMGVTLQDSLTPTTTASLTSGLKAGIVHDVVVHADPRRPPYSLRALYNALSLTTTVCRRVHRHSSVKEISEKLLQFWGNIDNDNRRGSVVCLTLVWRQTGDSPAALLPTLYVNPIAASQIVGEHNIGRYLTRLTDVVTGPSSLYESPSSPVFMTRVDEMLEQCHARLMLGTNKDQACFLREVDASLAKESFVAGSNFSLADLVLLSGLIQFRMLESSLPNVQKWSKQCLAHQLCKNLI